MEYKCELVEQPAQPIVSIRTRTPVGDMPQVLGNAFGLLMGYFGQQNEYPAGAPFVAYYNMDMQDLDIAIGFPVVRPLPDVGEVHGGEIPAGKAAVCLHEGSYQLIGAAYEALSAWMAEKGYTPTGLVYEYYLNDPEETPEDELLTRIVFPLV